MLCACWIEYELYGAKAAFEKHIVETIDLEYLFRSQLYMSMP